MQKVEQTGTPSRNWGIVKPADQLSLRPHVDRALGDPQARRLLPAGQCDLAPRLREHNPLNAGLPPDRTCGSQATQPVPPFDEEREEAGKRLIETFVLPAADPARLCSGRHR